ncbi:MAG: UDP-2,3-diacylglucosamine diphosphatase [Planctomycetes bacterium]|nr:UDP-2,3-diacylglucosamine diphosphatase [Planctomycetota bacterium]
MNDSSRGGPGPTPFAGQRLLFISDCHVTPAEPARGRRLLRFLEAIRRTPDPDGPVSTLYVLGDLFDYWLGPAHVLAPDHAEVLAGLRATVDAGIGVRFLPGNRDFLAGEELERATGARVAGDEEQLLVGGRRVLLLHGDVLCGRDTRYLAWRRLVRARPVRALARSLPARLLRPIALAARGTSRRLGEAPGAAAVRAMLPATMEALFRRTGVDAVVCGHAHRPRRIDVRVGGGERPLFVLGDWDGPAVVLEARRGDLRFVTFE